MSDKKWIKERAWSRNWDTFYNLSCPECGATFREISETELTSYRYCPACGMAYYDKKLETLSRYAVQLVLDEIRIQRKTMGLDPVWYPTEEWLTEKFRYFLEVFESVQEEDRNG
jgi:uncharacterized C2H2 Zn-finger protein